MTLGRFERGLHAHLSALAARVGTRGIQRNGLFSAVQALVTILCTFLSYRILIMGYGLEALGLWALLSVFAGLAATVDVSGASALARSVALHETEFSDVTRADVIHTVLLTSMIINGLVVFGLLVALPHGLPRLISSDQLQQAWSLVPWIAGLMVIMPLAVGISASIDGLMRADLRAVLGSGAAIAGLAVAATTIPRIGVMGLAIAQCVQHGMVIFGGWMILRYHIPDLGPAPYRWKASVSGRTMGYAFKLTAISLFGLLLEPLTKYCVSYAGGTAAVGVYELAARLVVQLRSLVVAATRPLVPAFAASDTETSHFADMVLRSQRFALYAGLVVALTSLIGAPIMCLIILGYPSTDVLRFSSLLAFGWSVNLFSLPLYIVAQGRGILRWNIASHAASGLTVLLVGLLVAPLWGAWAVVFGLVAGLVIGAWVTTVGNAMAFGQTAAIRGMAGQFALFGALLLLFCAAGWFAAPLIGRYGLD